MELQFILGGALVGFIVGATGVGGGSLMTPLLTLVFGVPAQVAVGTDLLFASLTKANGALAHARRSNVDWQMTGRLAAGSIPASLITLLVVHHLGLDARQFGALVSHTLGAALLVTATALMLRAQIQELGRRVAGSRLLTTMAATTEGAAIPVPAEPGSPALATCLVGFAIGVLVTLTSVGAGVIGVVALYFLYPDHPARRIVGADIAHAVPLTLIAGLGHATLGTVNWAMLGALLIGSLPAIMVGAALAHRLPERALRAFLAAMLVLIGLKLLLG
jgi:uncharacterized protein